jgi:hypothetical protein
VRHDQRPKEWSGHTRDCPRAAGCAQRPPAFVRRINNSEENKRKSRNGSRSDALDGASADELHHRARDGAEAAPDRERDNADEVCAPRDFMRAREGETSRRHERDQYLCLAHV